MAEDVLGEGTVQSFLPFLGMGRVRHSVWSRSRVGCVRIPPLEAREVAALDVWDERHAS